MLAVVAAVLVAMTPQALLAQTNGAPWRPLLTRTGSEVGRSERSLMTTVHRHAIDPTIGLQWWRAAVGADRVNPPGPGAPVTVVDSGVDISHPEFTGRPDTMLLNAQTTDGEDEDHGTEVASVIGAPKIGVYPGAVLNVWDASPFGFLNEAAAIQGIYEAARRGPGVINLSFGGVEDDPLLADAIWFAFRSGSLIVAAAGNEGLDGSPPNFPAFYRHVLTVGATDESGRVAPFSTLSATIDMAAPGVHIPVAEPVPQEASGYVVASGTSFASPLVAGAAAWVWTMRPELDNTQLFELMRRSATDIAAQGFDKASGYGLLNIPRALNYRTPTSDPQEPNDKPREIEAKGLFSSATPPLTTAGHTAGSITARVDRSDDPIDLYRVWTPTGHTLRAQVTGSVRVRVLERAAQVRALALGKRGVAAYRNHGKGTYVYVEIRPAVRLAEYRLRITAVRR